MEKGLYESFKNEKNTLTLEELGNALYEEVVKCTEVFITNANTQLGVNRNDIDFEEAFRWNIWLLLNFLIDSSVAEQSLEDKPNLFKVIEIRYKSYLRSTGLDVKSNYLILENQIGEYTPLLKQNVEKYYAMVATNIFDSATLEKSMVTTYLITHSNTFQGLLENFMLKTDIVCNDEAVESQYTSQYKPWQDTAAIFSYSMAILFVLFVLIGTTAENTPAINVYLCGVATIYGVLLYGFISKNRIIILSSIIVQVVLLISNLVVPSPFAMIINGFLIYCGVVCVNHSYLNVKE